MMKRILPILAFLALAMPAWGQIRNSGGGGGGGPSAPYCPGNPIVLSGATPVLSVTPGNQPCTEYETQTLVANDISITTPAASALTVGKTIVVAITQAPSGGPYTIPTTGVAGSPFTAGSGVTIQTTENSQICPTVPTTASGTVFYSLFYNATGILTLKCGVTPPAYTYRVGVNPPNLSRTSTTGGFWSATEGNAPTGETAGEDTIYADSTHHTFEVSIGSGAFGSLVRSPGFAAGQAVLGTGAITNGTCATAVTGTVTNTTTSSVLTWSFASDPNATGYGYGGLIVAAFPTADTVNFRVCNPTAAPITPSAMTLNYRVLF
jgi:hypothetical protein